MPGSSCIKASPQQGTPISKNKNVVHIEPFAQPYAVSPLEQVAATSAVSQRDTCQAAPRPSSSFVPYADFAFPPLKMFSVRKCSVDLHQM